jgi:hypothetical protein
MTGGVHLFLLCRIPAVEGAGLVGDGEGVFGDLSGVVGVLAGPVGGVGLGDACEEVCFVGEDSGAFGGVRVAVVVEAANAVCSATLKVRPGLPTETGPALSSPDGSLLTYSDEPSCRDRALSAA